MNVIHIGAGNIGKGFIYPVLEASNQIESFVFLDVNKETINYLKQHQTYQIKLADEKTNTKLLCQDYLAFELDEIFQANNLEILKKVNLITISIGQQNLIHLVDFFQRINKIISQDCIIMCCENGYKVSSYFKTLLSNINSNFYFVDCLVDRIIPVQNFLTNNELIVEKYYSWVCDQSQWPTTIQKITSLTYSSNIEFEIYKKMCMLNGVHCALAWYEYHDNKFSTNKTVSDALANSKTLKFIKSYLTELTKIIALKYQVNQTDLVTYSDIVLKRFKNNFIDDQLVRVGRNPLLKLQKDERILSPILFALQHNLDCKNLLKTFKNGLHYFYESEKQGIIIKENIYNKEIKWTLSNLFHLNENEINIIRDNI